AARADDAPGERDRELSKRLYQAGQRAFEAGRFDVAASLFEQAFGESHRPELLWNAAAAHRRRFEATGDIADLKHARDELEQFGVLTNSPTDRDEALRQLQAVDEQLKRASAKPAGVPAIAV